jgi:ubiquinone/menaquinone biosynthesis C-methylase UbiE
MADESMLRTLAAQAEAIWPQEKPIFDRHPLELGTRVLDIGCGPAEIVVRLAEHFRDASFVGVDLEEEHLERARARCRGFADRASFQIGDALDLPFADRTFDLVISRHVLQAVPDPGRGFAEMVRVLRPGGRIHALVEDYGMLWCHPTEWSAETFWGRYPIAYAKALGCDLHVGRKAHTFLFDLGLTDIRVDYAVVDTNRVPRETFARIWEAWRDGYTDPLAEHTGVPRAEVAEYWRQMIACVRDPRGYALWQVPIWTAQKSR